MAFKYVCNECMISSDFKIKCYIFSVFQLDLQLQDELGGDLSSFVTNGEWELLGRFSHSRFANQSSPNL